MITKVIKMAKKIIPILFIFLVTCLFFYKTILKDLIPFPGDMLVGAYYPWLDYKWSGFTTNVPIKNPLITDVFSSVYPSKELVINSIKSFKIPLWNQFSYSGHPFLANFSSSYFNPLNLLMLISKPPYGWTIMIFFQFFFSTLTMYLFLKEIYKKKISSIIGSITYGFSGFAIVWSQFATAGFALIWLPLIFLSIEHFFKTRKIKYLFYLSPLYFLLMTAGHFQALIYGCFFSGFYFLWKLLIIQHKTKIKVIFYTISVVLGLALMAIQLLPTIELSKNSIRFSENYISKSNYGLFSLDKIVTIFAPDYFGNPTTFNYRGVSNYFETVIYMGILAIFSLIFSIYNFKKLKNEKFFLFINFFVLFLAFNTFLGKLVYLVKTPGLSTSSAGRIIFISVFCFSILTAYFIEEISIHNLKNTIRYYWGYFLFLILITISTFVMYKKTSLYIDLQKNYMVSIRNLFFPIVLSFLIVFILAFIKKTSLKRFLLLLIVILDLFRFGWKFTPFVKKEYVFPKTDIINFLQNQPGLFRVEKEKGPLLTPNTWMAYGLSSSSGYDSLALNSYYLFYNQNLNGQKTSFDTSRYSEIDNYDATALGEANVKYLLVLKYNEINKINQNGNYLNNKINQKDWKKVYEYGSVVILENTKLKPRIEILNQKNQESIKNIYYSANKIYFQTNSTEDNAVLVLRDTWFPGWKAFVNKKEVPIDKYLNIYRQINIPKGKSEVEFIYKPKSFYNGLYISIISLMIWILLIVKFRNTKI
ncbi:MAG: YfhO family protein [Candidatus Shapirobacteria bacterium]|jgi:uncharacterized membrane protein YfhO